MPQQQIYHTAQPEAIQDGGYKEFNNCDFVLNVGAGRSLMRNTIRLNGEIEINSAGVTRVLATDDIYLDPKIGVHATIASLQVSFSGSLEGQGGGIRENVQNYARFCEMLTVGTDYEDDYNNASNAVEHRCVNNISAQLLAQGLSTGSDATGDEGYAARIVDHDFSLKPVCILNRMQGDHLPYEKTGEIRLSVNLQRNIAALCGVDQAVESNYVLKNLHMSYISVPTDGLWSSTKTSMSSVYNVKSSILSGSTNVSVQVPAICQSVSCSFQRQSNENVVMVNNAALQTVQNIKRVAFLFNDSTNAYITYQIDDQNEMLHRYIDSFENTGHNQVMLDTFRTNAGFGLGLDFNGSIDLSNQRFAVQLDSDVNSNKPMNIYLYFHSLISA